MVSRLTKLFGFHENEDQREINRSPRKRKNSNPLDDVPIDGLVTPPVKRVRFSPNVTNAQVPSPVTRFASWVKMKASNFTTNYIIRPLANGTDADHGPPELNGPPSHDEPRDCNGPINRNGPADCRRQEGRRPVSKVSLHAERHVTKRSKHRDNGGDPFVHPNPPSPDLARRPLHGHRHQDRKRLPPERSHHQMRQHHHHHPQQGSGTNGVTPDLPLVENKVEQWHRSHILRPEIASDRDKNISTITSTQATLGSSIHDRLFNLSARPSPGPDVSQRYSVSRRRTTVEECIRMDDRRQYLELLHRYTDLPLENTIPSYNPFANATAPSGGSTLPDRTAPLGGSLLLDRTASLYRTQEVRVSKPAKPNEARSSSPIVFDLTRSRSPSVAGSQSPPRVVPQSLNLSAKLSSVMAMKEALACSPYVTPGWVEEMKEKFESSARISKRKIEEQTAAYKQYREKRELQKEIERKKAEEKIQSLIASVKESSIQDVEKEFPLVEHDLEPEIELIVEEEEEEEILPELTEDMEAEVDSALGPGQGNQELVSGFRIQLTRADIHTLKGLNWLNDEVMNFYFNLLVDRGDHNNNLPKVHAFNTFFYPKLLKDGYASLRRWTKRVDVFSKDMLLVPIHLGVHWCLAIMDFRSKCITYYDSMGGLNNKCLNALRDYLDSEHQDKKKSPYDVSDWELVHARDIPLQLNGSDCGVFACKFAEYATRNAPPTFNQEHMPYFRRRMVWELLHKKLL